MPVTILTKDFDVSLVEIWITALGQGLQGVLGGCSMNIPSRVATLTKDFEVSSLGKDAGVSSLKRNILFVVNKHCGTLNTLILQVL